MNDLRIAVPNPAQKAPPKAAPGVGNGDPKIMYRRCGLISKAYRCYTSDAVFMGTDKTERWTIDAFKTYAAPAFEDGHGWTYKVVERNWEGDGNTRWFDEILFNDKLGHCRGTGVVEKTDGNWKIAHYSLTLLIPNDIAETVGSQSKRADS